MARHALAPLAFGVDDWRDDPKIDDSSVRSRHEIVELDAGDMPAISSYLCSLSAEGRRRRFHAWVDDGSIRTFCSAIGPGAFGAVARIDGGVIVGLAELHADPTGLLCEIALSSTTEGPAWMGDLLAAALALARRRGARSVEYVWLSGEAWAPEAFRALGGSLDHPGRCASLDLNRNDAEACRSSLAGR